MNDILLLFPRPSPSSPQRNPALSIFFPGEAAARAGFAVDYWDERFDSGALLAAKMEHAKAFGVSALSGYQLGRAAKLLRECKKHYPDRPTILGGVHATFSPQSCLAEPYIDYVVMGEGEERLPALLSAIRRGYGWEVIDGVGYRTEEGAVRVNTRLHILNLEHRYTSPLSSRTMRYFKLAAARDEVILPTSRGCPWANKQRACAFCSVRDQYLGTYRPVPYGRWAEDLDRLYWEVPFFRLELQDENAAHFLTHPEYARFLYQREIKYHLHLRADQLQKIETVQFLAQTGCQRVHVGVEAASDRVRNDIYHKGERLEDFYNVAHLLAGYGIEGVYTFIVGAPTETREEIEQTLRLSDELSNIHPRGMCRATFYVLMALPGTDIYTQAEQAGWKLPHTLKEWTKVSAATNPAVPRYLNNLYYIAGLHHNRFHKTPQNFPGAWRALIAPFEALCALRWHTRCFGGFAVERVAIEALLGIASRRNPSGPT